MTVNDAKVGRFYRIEFLDHYHEPEGGPWLSLDEIKNTRGDMRCLVMGACVADDGKNLTVAHVAAAHASSEDPPTYCGLFTVVKSTATNIKEIR